MQSHTNLFLDIHIHIRWNDCAYVGHFIWQRLDRFVILMQPAPEGWPWIQPLLLTTPSLLIEIMCSLYLWDLCILFTRINFVSLQEWFKYTESLGGENVHINIILKYRVRTLLAWLQSLLKTIAVTFLCVCLFLAVYHLQFPFNYKHFWHKIKNQLQ